jgi:hypothetical protein
MLNDMPADQREQWAAETFEQIRQQIPTGEVTMLAGPRYRECLVPRMESAGYVVNVPMAHMGIGQQMHWLAEQVAGAWVVQTPEPQARILIDHQLEQAGWLVQDSADLPDPNVLAAEIVEDLQAALEQFSLVAEEVGTDNGGRESSEE